MTSKDRPDSSPGGGAKPVVREVRLAIDSIEPIGGWICGGTQRRARFDGWLELLSRLQQAIGEAPPGPADHRGRRERRSWSRPR